ncbi:MAG: HU family DNA-binding protein [Pseudomonadota bacterium]
MANKDETPEPVTDVEETAEVADAETETDQRADLIRKRDVYNHVTVSTGLRKREVREAVDATLAYLHTCLAEGKDLQLPPLGKVRTIDKSKGDTVKMIHRLVLQKQKQEDEAPAEAAE